MTKKLEERIMLVAFDGSPSSVAALVWASKKAPLLGLKIEVVNVWEYAESSLELAAVGFGSGGYVGESDPKIWSDQILKEGVGIVYGENSDEVKMTSVEGAVTRTLVELSNSAELLVMGSRGHGKFADLILGSISSNCSAKSKCPVVIVHKAS